ncbi:MAG: 7TM-DISM domain-containing protein [Polyangiales bacterium]
MGAVRTPGARLVVILGLVALASSLQATRVRAERVLDVGLPLDERSLGQTIDLLEDPSRTLDFDDVRRPEHARRFRPSYDVLPSFGFTRSVYWVRFTVHNPRGEERTWVLEHAYPHTDHLALYVPTADGSGYEPPRLTGDHLPFSSRELQHRTFLFRLREPPASRRTYYLRVETDGSMLIPLVAWEGPTLLANQPRDLGVLFLFYGVCVAMVAYNAFAFLLVRRLELLTYIAQILATGLIELNISGHAFQFFFPDQPWLAEGVHLGAFGAIASTSCYISDAYLSLRDEHPRLSRTLRMAGHAGWVMVPLAFVLRYDRMIQVLVQLLAVSVLMLVAIGAYLVHVRAARVRLFLAMASLTVAGLVTQLLRARGLVPNNFWTTWSIHIGCSLQLVMLTSALADWLSSMRSDVSALNAELSSKVSALEGALSQAGEATARAEQATRVRDEFVATMSHELRTPLNAIINVPQGLLREFRPAAAATCEACRTLFELEASEQVEADTPCPECGACGRLRPHEHLQYRGDPARTAHYLTMIERSGKHLLQMVDSVLDASKLGAGRLTMTVERSNVQALVREAVEPMTPLAERAGIRIDVDVAPEVSSLTVDPVRIRQVLLNLLSNALKFSEGRGPVTVRVRDAGDRCEFAVQDRGIGIAERDFARIFSSFEQVHRGNTRRYGGTGLGLSISRSLVRMHGGEMWFHSEVGQGTTFFFDIPKRLGEGAQVADNDNGTPPEVLDPSAMRSSTP